MTEQILHLNIARLLWDSPHLQRTAVAERGGDVSYGHLRSRAAALASALTERGIEPGDRVGILLERGADAAAAFFGVAAAGAAAININERLRTRQIDHILSHSGARFLVTRREALLRLPRPLSGHPLLLDIDDIPSEGVFDPLRRVSTDLAQIIYTSGSTGLPKGVAISHGNLWAGMATVVSYLGIVKEDRIASLLPFSFDYGFNQLLCAVGTGACVEVEKSPVPSAIVERLRTSAVTVLPAVPSLWLRLLSVPDFHRPLPGLRAMTNTGGRIPTPAVRQLRAAQAGADLFLMYGLTEAFRATFLPPEEVDSHPDSIGKAVPGSEIMLVRDDGSVCGPGETGELVQRGPTVALGYWGDEVTTARVYRRNPALPAGMPDRERVVFSGDLVRTDKDGFLYFVGRRDALIKSLGHRVSPDEVANVIYASSQVLEAAVVGQHDEARGQCVVAYIVLKPEGSLEEVWRYCKIELPRYMQPKRIEVLNEIPRTSSEKYDTHLLNRDAHQAQLRTRKRLGS